MPFCLLHMTVLVCGVVAVSNNETSELYYLSLEPETQAGNLMVHCRSNSSDNKVVCMNPGDTLRLDLCVAYNTSVGIMGVLFYCVETDTTVDLFLDGMPLGNFSTGAQSTRNNFWNEIHDSGPIGSLQNLEPGRHYVDLYLNPDQIQGIEIDRLYIGTTDKYITADILACQLNCMCELNEPELHPPETDIKPARFIQRSFPTKCAEEDNVDIALIHPTVQAYRITSFYPGYNSMLSYHRRDFRNCEDVYTEQLWLIKNNPYDMKHNVLINIQSMELDLNSSKPLTVKILFPLKGKSKGFIDADIGSVLMIKFKEIVHDFSIAMSFKGRHERISSEVENHFSKTCITALWSIPDYSWSDQEFNEIELLFATNESQQVVLDYISFNRRQERGETVTTLYENVDTAIVGVNVDFWWRRPHTMTVTMEDGIGDQKLFENIDYIQLQKRILGSSNTSQIFVLYQDGNIRSLPPPIHGLDCVPFGSSVIIGPSDLMCLKPAADIQALHIYQVVPTLRFQITYRDNSTASVEVDTYGFQTEVLVHDIDMAGNRTDIPFARFRSMWVTNGNCNVDHFKINGADGQPILTDWKKLESTWAKFYRSCESKHLNKSPDMCIELLQ